MDMEAFDSEKVAKRMQVGMEQARQAGETLNTGFDPATLATDLAGLGLRLYEDLSPSDIKKVISRDALMVIMHASMCTLPGQWLNKLFSFVTLWDMRV